MKYLLIIFFISSMAFGQIAEDKQLHMIAGVGCSIAGYQMGYGAEMNRKKARFWGVMTPLIVGTLKELVDIKSTGFDVEDLAYTVGSGIVFTYSIDFLEGIKKRNKE